MNRKSILLILALFVVNIVFAQDKTVAAVEHAVNDLKDAMISGDSAKLAAIVADDLTYGHSGGSIQDKAAFIHSFVDGSSDFVTIDLSKQTVRIYGNTAVVTHFLNATSNDKGVPGTVALSVLTVWVKEKGSWKLVARQAGRPHA